MDIVLRFIDVLLNFVVYFVLPILLATSMYFSIRLKWPQFRYMGKAFRYLLVRRNKERIIDNFAAIAIIIGGNLGAGAITGVALAISLGGSGVIFWMAIIAIFGSVIKLGCSTLGVFYQEKQPDGRYVSGPMFYLDKALSSRFMGICYCLFMIGASLLPGTLAQSQALVQALPEGGSFLKLIYVLALAIPVGIIFFGGLKRFAAFMSRFVPIMGIFYIGACCIGLYMMRQRVGPALREIFHGAFSLSSLGGGLMGIVFVRALYHGVSRAIMASDIGVGLAGIAHGAVERAPNVSLTQHARKHGIASMLAPFLVAMVCVITGILVVCATPNLLQNPTKICVDVFTISFRTPYAGWVIPIVIYSFALTTILGWAWFAEHGFTFIKREHWCRYYRLCLIIMTLMGAFVQSSLPWILGDICFDGLLLINIYAVWRLRGKIISIQNSEE